MSMVRFAMFAERAVEVVSQARQIQGVSVKDVDTGKLADVLRAKAAATRDIATFEALLYPPDEAVN